MSGRDPVLTPPRGGGDIGDYSLRDFAMKWLVQQADLAEVGRYREANRTLAADDRRRLVLFGDSITEFWAGAARFAGTDWHTINRGIAGQNTTQMLLRFEDDVVALRPTAVMVLGGTNDLRCYAGPPAAIEDSALERIARHVTAMADIARARGIAMVIGTLPPVGTGSEVYRDGGAIVAVNAWLARFAVERGLGLVDYHAALAEAAGTLSPDMSDDGVHPNDAAYARMEAALRPALTAVGLHIDDD